MERDKALEAALSQIEKQFGKGSVMRMGEHPGMGIEVISTGAMALDVALGRRLSREYWQSRASIARKVEDYLGE
jgi:RecA/RadA recombinase